MQMKSMSVERYLRVCVDFRPDLPCSMSPNHWSHSSHVWWSLQTSLYRWSQHFVNVQESALLRSEEEHDTLDDCHRSAEHYNRVLKLLLGRGPHMALVEACGQDLKVFCMHKLVMVRQFDHWIIRMIENVWQYILNMPDAAWTCTIFK